MSTLRLGLGRELLCIPDELLGGDLSADTFAENLLERVRDHLRPTPPGWLMRVIPLTKREVYDQAIQVFVDLLRATPATSSVVVLDMDRAIVRYHLKLGGLPPLAERDQVLIKHLRVVEMVTVHHLHHGWAPCSRENKALRTLPKDWPEGHAWSSAWSDVTCLRCLALRDQAF